MDFTFDKSKSEKTNRFRVEYEGPEEMGCSGLYIVIDLGDDRNGWYEVTNPMEFDQALKKAKILEARFR
jgi:hypothetical protein